MARAKPSRAASLSRRWVWETWRSSPARPTSPHMTRSAANGRLRMAETTASDLTQLAEDLMFINGQWLAEQMVTAHVLQQHTGRLESHEPLAQKLEVLLIQKMILLSLFKHLLKT